MPLLPGTRLGPYDVVVKIGEGGMGEVYRARDTRLDRDVALKIFYIDLAERLMAVPVSASTTGTFTVGAPAALFQANIGGAVPPGSGPYYMVSPDGQRFLMDTVVDQGPPSPISVILNWRPAP